MGDKRKQKFLYTLPFPVESLQRISFDDLLSDMDGFMAVRKRGKGDTSRRLIKDEAFLVPFNVLKTKIDEQVNDHATYNTIAERDADPQSKEPSSVSYVRNSSGDPKIGRLQLSIKTNAVEGIMRKDMLPGLYQNSPILRYNPALADNPFRPDGRRLRND